MGRNINSYKLSKQYILSKVSQITIFSTYLNLSDAIIQYCIDKNELICSPIRDDVHPTCGFRYDNRGKLKFRDFSGAFWGDCFDIVAYVMSQAYNKQYNVNDKEDFIKILRHITFTFKDIFYGQEKDINMINEINTAVINLKNKKPIIELVVRDWNKKDEKYWNRFGITLQYLNVNLVYPIDQYYINRNVNPKPKYYYDDKDPCYGYNLGKDRNGVYSIKLYFPNRKKGEMRFITNCNHLEGIYNLDKNNYDYIIITKSTKDRLSIGNFITKQYLYGQFNIGIINIPHETYRLRQNEFDWLNGKIKTGGYILSLMDNDKTGKKEAIWLRDNYRIIPLIIPATYNSKDFAELYENNSINTIKKLIHETWNNLKDYELKNIQCKEYLSKQDDSLPY